MEFNPDKIYESFVLKSENPIGDDPERPMLENKVADVSVKDVRVAYPHIAAINAERLTRNNTFYLEKGLIGKNRPYDPTGYASFARPYPKPFIREHNLTGGIFTQGEKPMGRVVWAGYRGRKKADGPANPAPQGLPGTIEGIGAIHLVPCISDQEAVPKVLGGAYHTVSIGSRVEKITESISGQDIAALRRQGKELPPFEKGTWYEIDGEKKLSYWMMGEIRALECSYVNVPSDEYAGTLDPDIGAGGLRVLLGEKKPGKANEFAFYDPVSGENMTRLLEMDEFCFAPGFEMVDSLEVGKNILWVTPETQTESLQPPQKTWEGKDAVLGGNKVRVVLENGEICVVRDERGRLYRAETAELRTYTPPKPKKKAPEPAPLPVDEAHTAALGMQPKVAEYDKPRLKEFFAENCHVPADELAQDPDTAPLSVMLATSEWQEEQYVWAYRFRHIAENAANPEIRLRWGITQPKAPPTPEAEAARIIREVLNG